MIRKFTFVLRYYCIGNFHFKIFWGILFAFANKSFAVRYIITLSYECVPYWPFRGVPSVIVLSFSFLYLHFITLIHL